MSPHSVFILNRITFEIEQQLGFSLTEEAVAIAFADGFNLRREFEDFVPKTVAIKAKDKDTAVELFKKSLAAKEIAKEFLPDF